MTHIRLMIIVLAVTALSACTQNTRPLNFTLTDVAQVPSRQDAELKLVSVTSATAGATAGKISRVTDLALPAWKAAIEDAIDRATIFRDDAQRKLSLSVKVTQFDVPAGGFDMTTTTTAHYELIDRNSRTPLFVSDITSTGHVPLGYAFTANERAWESVNRAVQASIRQFIDQLGSADLSKPLVPATVKPATSGAPSS